MSITELVQADMTAAMKAGEKEKTAALRLILSQLKLGQKNSAHGFSEEDEIAVLALEKKRRLQAAEAFRGGGRDDRAEAEEAEAAIIDGYLPQSMGEAELAAVIDEAIAESGASGLSDMGMVMKSVMAKAHGRVDGKLASELVKKSLSGQ